VRFDFSTESAQARSFFVSGPPVCASASPSIAPQLALALRDAERAGASPVTPTRVKHSRPRQRRYNRRVGEPQVKSYFATASRDAVRDVFGDDGLATVAATLTPIVRDHVLAEHLPQWTPERSLIALHYGIYETVAGRDRETYFRVLRRMTERSFGVVRKLLVTMASPDRLLESASAVWKADHTHGALEVRREAKRAVGYLRDSPYTEEPHTRLGISENLRYVLELSGAKGVLVSHALVSPGVLEMKFRWA
jgi:hypothetical protein